MPLTADERALVAHVDAHNDEALALLERAVNINSGTQNFAGVREVGKLFDAELVRLGFKTAWVDGSRFNRAGHLVAERPGKGPRVLLIGHLDTVFEPDSPFQKFERVGPNAARGPGIIDMKGGDVIMIHALKALAAVGALDNLHVTVVMTGDEESAGEPQSAAREALVSAAKGAAIAIGFEDGAGDPKTAVIGRRGTTAWTLRVKGTPAHSSQIFRKDLGYGAVFEAARILNTFREKLAGEAHLTFNPAAVVAGTQVDFDTVKARGSAFGKDNVIAEHAIVSGDLRALSLEQFANARKAMEAIVATSASGYELADHVRRRVPTAGPNRRQPPIARHVRPGEPRRRRRPCGGRQPRHGRRGRRVVRRRACADDPRRHRSDGGRRAHRQRDRRPADAALTDEARSAPAVPTDPGAVDNNSQSPTPKESRSSERGKSESAALLGSWDLGVGN